MIYLKWKGKEALVIITTLEELEMITDAVAAYYGMTKEQTEERRKELAEAEFGNLRLPAAKAA